MYQKLGLVKPYETKDLGRFDVTGAPSDRFIFKVPSLRNIAMTAPYFHDGSIETLPEVIRTMAEYQLGKTLDDEQVSAIEAFLGSLTGRIDAAYTKKPELPPSGPDTPVADPT
jgi:cytochrome c peroxidase